MTKNYLYSDSDPTLCDPHALKKTQKKINGRFKMGNKWFNSPSAQLFLPSLYPFVFFGGPLLPCSSEIRTTVFSQQGFSLPTKPWCSFPPTPPPPAANCLSGSSHGGSVYGDRLEPLGITAHFLTHDPRDSPKADYRSQPWFLIPEGRQSGTPFCLWRQQLCQLLGSRVVFFHRYVERRLITCRPATA